MICDAGFSPREDGRDDAEAADGDGDDADRSPSGGGGSDRASLPDVAASHGRFPSVEPEPDEEPWLELFVSGDSVDWSAALDEAHGPVTSALRGLADLARIRSAYDSAEQGENDEAASTTRSDSSESRHWDSSVNGAESDLGRFGGYRVIEALGKGGFARVVRARDERMERDVALKVLPHRQDLPLEVVARFLREGRALGRLAHPSIVRIHHVIDDPHALGLCMEYIEGETLEEYASRRGQIGPDEAALIGIEVASALECVHRADFVHRDVKAGNVMREVTGRIVLMDFGITRSMDSTSRVTATGVLIGTPLAMAPEQFEFREADARTDIYALGCLLYRLLAGRSPVEGDSVETIRDRVLEGKIPPLRALRPEIPPELEAIIFRAMHRRPERRFSSARALEDALQTWLTEYRPPRTGRSRRWPWILAGVVAVSAAIALALWYRARGGL
jgi:serine/threonine protein kinase